MYHSFLIHSSADGHLGCVPILAIVNSAVMNIGVHVSLSVLVSSVCMPRSGIAGSYGSLGQGRHKTQAQPSLRLCGVPENLNLSGLGLGSACNSGHAPCRATWSLSSVDGESTCALNGDKPSVAGTLRVLPTHASGICLQCPSLPTARLNKPTKHSSTAF